MIPLPLTEVEPLGELVGSGRRVTGVHVDSRRIAPGELFVAVGEAGRAFVPDALERGGLALLADDPHRALAALAGAVRSRSSARVVGITGSTGKTSTKDILAALCAPHRRTIAAEASFNNEIGVPLTLCRLEPDSEVCIVELAMRGLGQIDWLCSFARPDIGVITNIGPVHLELVETVERVAQAKAELLRCVRTAVVPDEPLLAPFLPDGEIRRFSERDLLSFADGHASFRVGERTVELDLPLSARYQALNALAALHAYDALGLPLDDVQRGASQIALARLRGEELPLPGGGVLINDCYNANPISMRAALAHLAERAGAQHRRVAVLGDMAELGAGAPGYHREIGAAAAALGVQQLVAIGELARGYVEGAAGVPSRWAPTVEEGIAALRDELRPGDVVLVKASRAIGLEAVAENIVGVVEAR
jgi:UDP-N-acetylmuramoyl-tripeptide--D-alanyl-D-alanine ligase